MAIGVPRIWTLHKEAKSLLTCTAADLAAMAKIQSLLPQGENNLPWYVFTDEAVLVKAGLVYDKEFNPEAHGDPPSWEEIIAYTDVEDASTDVEFDEML
ncbi:hypothetical protein LIER_39968 [Lithospermum erythrorhizon]|uniref:Uncharacterized protein n=1 Tax=Lithospermum erythrorhizon TaxID=34254 RepID=A0AAV3QP89_LITER